LPPSFADRQNLPGGPRPNDLLIQYNQSIVVNLSDPRVARGLHLCLPGKTPPAVKTTPDT
jgi:hypothetical protein